MNDISRYKKILIVPAIASILALSAGAAWADEAPPVPAKLVKKQAEQAHQTGMKHGRQQMHDQMMHDHQMGVQASGGMAKGCDGKPGCIDKMPMGPKANGPAATPAPDAPAMPMNDM